MIELDLRLPLSDFALEVKLSLEGGAVALMGPSGSGKTSLLEAIAGLRPRATGRIALGEHVLLDSNAGVRLAPEARRIGWVPQDARLFPHLNVEANVGFGRGATAESVRWALSLTEVAHLAQRWPASLSGGERQRVALARALAIRPRLLLLDEPLAALDEGLKGRLLPQLLKVREDARIPLLWVTHQRAEAEVLGGELLCLERGRVAVRGNVTALRERLPLEPDPGENLVRGDLVRTPEGGPRLRLAGGHLLVVPDLPGRSEGPMLFSVRAEDLLLATAPVDRISARNVLEGRVLRVERSGEDASVEVEAAGRVWRSKVTFGAVERLGLRPGEKAWVVVKAHAFAPVG